MNLRAWARGLLAINGAIVVRAVRCGLSDALNRAREALVLIDPFGSKSDLSGIPTVDLSQIIGDPPDVLVDARYAATSGSLPMHELIPLLAIAKHHQPRGVLEIGTFFGSTTRNLAINLPLAKVHTADLPPDFSPAVTGEKKATLPMDDFHLIEGRQLGLAFSQKPEAHRIIQHLGDTATYDFSTISDPLDFFFVDGSHTYDYARNDTLRCMELASAPSILIWHDLNPPHPGVVRWIMEMRQSGLDVRRIRGTTLGYLPFSPEDAAVARLTR